MKTKEIKEPYSGHPRYVKFEKDLLTFKDSISDEFTKSLLDYLLDEFHIIKQEREIFCPHCSFSKGVD